LFRRVVWQKFTDVSLVLAAYIIVVVMVALMMEAVGTSETSVNFYETTWSNISQGSQLHTRRRENLKSHLSVDRFLKGVNDSLSPVQITSCRMGTLS
jgi:hypothetical protein